MNEKDYQAHVAKSLASIAESLKEIAEETRTTAAIFKKWDEKGLPPCFMDMTEAWKQRWSLS
ncbi:hypothetical protein [Pseudomonas sp. RC10]|uniref:hypothetical protein n=1 Tax=Pseudomonas bambusae TaxID=3139142 RepID=UPI00313A4AFF